MKNDLFFAFDVEAFWKEKEPEGKVLKKNFRHITLAFLAKVEKEDILKKIEKTPKPLFKIAPFGIFEKIVFLPPDKKRVLAYLIKWMDDKNKVRNYQKELSIWLEKNDFILNKKKFLEHVTICRAPFDKKKWMEYFEKIPFKISKLTLYESLGNSEYKNLWDFNFLSPFEEIKHTADIAFKISGENYSDLFLGGLSALFFKFPKLIDYFTFQKISFENIEDVIISLNDIISKADMDIGSPFKAVSFSSKISKKNNILFWEMIIDV